MSWAYSQDSAYLCCLHSRFAEVTLGFETGDALIAREEEGRLVLEKQETIKRRLKARFAQVPRDRSLADELIAERREEAIKEAAE